MNYWDWIEREASIQRRIEAVERWERFLPPDVVYSNEQEKTDDTIPGTQREVEQLRPVRTVQAAQ